MLKMEYCLPERSNPKQHLFIYFLRQEKPRRLFSPSMENLFDRKVWDMVDPQNVIGDFQFVFLELQEANTYNCSQTIVSTILVKIGLELTYLH